MAFEMIAHGTNYCAIRIFNTFTVYFSYETCVAIKSATTIRRDYISKTTESHLRKMGVVNFPKVSNEFFDRVLNELNKMFDSLKH